MKEIKLYEFNELNAQAKLNALANESSFLSNVVDTYISEIYTDHLINIERLFGIECIVTFNDYRVITIIKFEDEANYAIVNSGIVKAMLMIVAQKLNAGYDCIYKDELLKAISEYKEGSLYSFLRLFIASLDNTISDWAIRTRNEPQ